MSINRKKYVKLAPGEAMWSHEESGTHLVAYTEEQINKRKHVKAVEHIKHMYLPDFDKAVEKGILVYVDSPKEEIEVKAPRGPIVVNTTRRKFKEKEQKKGTRFGSARKSFPSFSGGNIDIDSDDPLDKKVFRLLAAPAGQVVKDIKSAVGLITKAVDKKDLLETCYALESNGKNPAMTPRPAVITYITSAIADLGDVGGLGKVGEESEAIVKDAKPLQLVL